ncbi:MAG: tetratricopeptide repeat protein, partial [Planctomycetes bacterium]|nr:tetratricopeptide repeat protein [Planctomycetota bacterium]
KPDNILVRAAAQAEATRDETDPERTAVAWPKIVDFGIARAVDPDQLGATQLTQAGQLIGTMAYMSPEQTTGNPEGIDVRCDVYALGVILFEVLAGTRPYRTDGMTLPDAARQIQEVTPPRLGALDRAFAGDLETIVAVALEKERERRYASASELGADLRRFLDDQPIAARPPSTIYQLRKFARRHRGLVAGVALAVVALLAGTAGTLWGLLDALEQGRRAKEEATKARSAEATARAAEVTAKTERDHARQAERDARDVSNFMHAVLESADIGVAGRQLSVKEVLDRNAARIDTLFKDRPVARAELHGAFGWDYFTFGDYAAAERHLRLAFELDSSARGRGDPATIEDCTRLCQVLDFAGKVDELGPIIQENVDVALRHLERDHPSTLHARMLLAAWHLGRHDYAPAELLYREIRAAMARTLGSNHDYTLSAINGLGLVLLNTGQYGEAEQLFRQAFEFRQAVHGLEHAKTLVPLINWANALSSEGRHRDAIEKYELVVKVGEKVWGKNHPELLSARGNLASALADGRELVRSRDLNAELYTHYLKTLGPADPDTLRTLNNLCVVLLDLQEFDEAERRVDTLLAAMTKLRGPQHSDTARAISLRAEVLNARIDSLPTSERPAAIRRCRELFARAVAIHEKHIGPRNPDTIIARNSLGAFLRDNKDPEAVKVLARVVADWQAAVPDSPSVLRLFRTSLGKALRQERRFAEAEREMLAAWKLPPHAKASNPELAKQLALLYDAWGKADAAKQWRERAANQGRESGGKAPPQQRGR